MPFYSGGTAWKLTTEEKMKCVLAALWTKTKSSRGESQAVSLCSPQLLNPLTTVDLFRIMPSTCLLGTILLCWSISAGEGVYILPASLKICHFNHILVRQADMTET